MPGTSSVSGLVSGMDTDGIISKLLELERIPIRRLETQKQMLKAKLTAWQDANTRILALKTKAELLANSSTFDSKLITSDDESIIKGKANYNAQTGTYFIRVDRLARAHQEKSDGYTDISSIVGTGKISITFTGTGATKEIDITDANNTLEGIKEAINQAEIGVTATIINNGSSTNPYQLIITSDKSGSDSQFTVSTTLTGGTSPTFTAMQTGQNALVTLGEGAGAIQVEKSTNQVSDLIPGVTLSLIKADASKTISINVTNDTTDLKVKIKEFVEQYNNLIDFINQQFKYDTTTNQAGTLFADSDLQIIQADLIGRLFSPVSGLSQSIKLLSQAGITSTTSDNKLALEEFDLDEVLGQSNGTEIVKRLFAAVGETTSSYVTFVSCTDQTKSTTIDSLGNPKDYAINITAVATQMVMTAGSALPAALAQDEQLMLNGQLIQLTAGMSADDVVAKINESKSKTGVIASKTDDGYLQFTSVNYGSAQKIIAVSNVTGTGSTGIGNAQNRVTAGAAQTQDLAQNETLTINGVTIELKAGMSQSEVISTINKYTAETGVVATRTDANGFNAGNYLTLTSALPGSSQNISVVSSVSNGGGTPVNNTSGIGNVTVTQTSAGGETGTGTGAVGSASGTLGTDVAGTINGEPATGSGQVLTGNTGNTNTAGLSIRVTAKTPGDYGSIRITVGIASMLNSYLGFITESTTGTVNAAQSTLEAQMKYIDDDIKVWEERIAAKQDRLVRQFAAMESALSKLQGQGQYLASQLSAASSGWK